jgi:hypothetical protein
LTIENEPGRIGRVAKLNTLHKAGLEMYAVTARFQEHHSTNWVRERYAGNECPNVFIIPHPATLEVGKLYGPPVNLLE